ncbi:MAG: glycosyltransferase [Acidimicrobiales bacterium]
MTTTTTDTTTTTTTTTETSPTPTTGPGGVHLFVPMLHRHDAVGEHTRVLRDRLRAAGIRSRIYIERPDLRTTDETSHFRDYDTDARDGDLLVYEVATASKMADWLVGRPEPLVLNYHSITPPDFFRPWNNDITRGQVEAEAQLRFLAPRAVLGVAVSHFDAAELTRAGCPRTEVVPVANVAVPPTEPDPATMARLRRRRGTGPQWLSVGRLAPNKSHERAVVALLATRTSSHPEARLTVVGAPTERHYAGAVTRFAAELGLGDAVDFVSGLSDAELAAHYRAADVFVMLSEHEGFGVPLIEAMGQGLPVVAYRAGAVAETVGDAAVLIDNTSPHRVARAVEELLADSPRQERLAEAGRRRVAELGLERAADRFVELVSGLRDAVPATN